MHYITLNQPRGQASLGRESRFQDGPARQAGIQAAAVGPPDTRDTGASHWIVLKRAFNGSTIGLRSMWERTARRARERRKTLAG